MQSITTNVQLAEFRYQIVTEKQLDANFCPEDADYMCGVIEPSLYALQNISLLLFEIRIVCNIVIRVGIICLWLHWNDISSYDKYIICRINSATVRLMRYCGERRFDIADKTCLYYTQKAVTTIRLCGCRT